MRKRSFVVCLLYVLCALFCACGNTMGKYVTKKCVSNQFSTGFNMRYEYFDGYKVYEYALKENCHVYINVETEEGSLDVYVTDEDGKAYVDKRALAAEEYEFVAPSDGKYTFRFTAKKHRGSFDVSW